VKKENQTIVRLKENPQTASQAILYEMQHQTALLRDIRKAAQGIQCTITTVILFLLFLMFAGGFVMVMGIMAARNSRY
jgi:hypothetical protein